MDSAHASKPLRLASLEFGRGIAAMMVALLHAYLQIAEPRHYGKDAFGSLGAGLGGGVDYFFVLSGFIITYVHWHDLGKPSATRRYFYQRITRIYPVYWAVLVPLMVMHFVTRDPDVRDPMTVVTSMLLIATPEHPILGVAWTLTHEMLFYFVFAMLIASYRSGRLFVIAWTALMVLVQITSGPNDHPLDYPTSFLLSSYNLEFLLGVVTAVWIRKGRVPFPATLLALGCAGFAAAFILTNPVPGNPWGNAAIRHFTYALCAVPIIAGGAELERSGRLVMGRYALILGASSYSIYLLHTVVESIVIRIEMRLPLQDASALTLTLLLAIPAIVAGVVFAHVVEKPLLRWVRSKPWQRLTAAGRDARAEVK